eukprot:CAMPEP_0203931566 /NCGR_PEP_ID=MMETSP0359-20131031/70134_1 /ASSEMBLY_ACC=CAM_ASM_000338 /TAXON_ID=268821 /ORGANISM="Scrippsiella Hangoei, Strain SHTV-5" /LENGTH=556 /DNA_ID=CAMNT_0050860925 /DNA_START=1 /DNA_END=1671 /DNA_ORIENTATION=-
MSRSLCGLAFWVQLLLGSARAPPHLIFVLVDDLGFGDVGFNSRFANSSASREIRTPSIDELVSEGVHLTRHYVHSTCTPTRTSAQSGRLPVHVQTTLKNPEEPDSGMPRNMTGVAEKLRAAGYHTHYVGKWDVGMATHKHTPRGRGYETSLIYFEHKNDYWTQKCMQSQCCKNFGSEDDQSDNLDLNITDLWLNDGPATKLNGTDYEEFIFLRHIEGVIEAHDPKEPLFLFYAPHLVHCPLQVPEEYLDKFSFMTDDEGECAAETPYVIPNQPKRFEYRCRQQYRAMVNLLDGQIGSLVQKLKAKGMWDDALLVFTADNGGPLVRDESGATNFPLRGGKYSNFEGGIRSAAFVSGGYLPPAVCGTVSNELVHIADWYATFAALAGIDAHDGLAARSGLPPVDGLDLWPVLSGSAHRSPRQELVYGPDALIQGRFKLLVGMQAIAEWSGPNTPNATGGRGHATLDCGMDGCLFDVVADPGEHRDLSKDMPDVATSLKQRLQVLKQDFFENSDRGVDSCPAGIGMPCACWMAVNHYGGYFGPYQEVDMGSSTLEEVVA